MANCIKLNLARNCLKYIIRAYGIKKIFIPYYTCETVWKAVQQENCKIRFYHINSNFMPLNENIFDTDSFILYINYFGLFEKNCLNLAKKYPNLIVDNTQSFYSPHIGLASFNSLRKFFPVTNGAYLFTEKKLHDKFEFDNLELPYASFENNYTQFVQNELLLNNETDIKLLNPKIEKIITNINFEYNKNIRRNIFKDYEKVFKKYNKIKLNLPPNAVPYCYPFSPNNRIIKEKLNTNNINLLQLWKNFPNTMHESTFANDIIAFPITNEIISKKIIKLIE